METKQTRRAGTAFDANFSLISIETADRSVDALLSAARRMRRQVRGQDSVFLWGTSCALLLPATPFSGAQAVARRITPLLSGFPCDVRVYHGATALLALQHLRAVGARLVTPEESDDLLSPVSSDRGQLYQPCQADHHEKNAASLPYLAFLTDYPSPRLLHLFPYEMACRYQCVPVGSERKMLTLATQSGLNGEVIAQLSRVARREIFQVRCEASIIEEVLRYWQRVRDLANLERVESKTDEMYSSAR